MGSGTEYRPFLNKRESLMGIEKYDEMARLVGEARAQYEEFVNGKKIAATRCRKALQQIKKVAQDARVEVQGIKRGPETAGGAPPPKPTP
jgi:histone H1-like protein Hc1